MEKSNRPSVEIATELGIKRNQLYKWKEQLENKGEDALTSKLGRPLKKDQSEVATLRQENERLREEVEILKKAAVYFAKELKWSMPLSIQSENTITLAGFVPR